MLGYFNGDIVCLEGASGLRSDQPCRRRVDKGDEFSTRLRRRRRHQPLLRQQPGRMVPAPLTSFPRLRQVRVPKLGAGDPAPGDGAVPRPAAAKPGRRRR